MTASCVLIVEDDPMIAFDVQYAMLDAGFQVCGIAISEAEAFALAEEFRPDFAIVDIDLSPGDGRIVASELWRHWRTGVLFATAWCNDIEGLAGTGAIACLPKPFDSRDLPRALEAVAAIKAGVEPDRLPDNMVTFSRAA